MVFGAEYWFNWNLQVTTNSNIMRKMQVTTTKLRLGLSMNKAEAISVLVGLTTHSLMVTLSPCRTRWRQVWLTAG